MNLGHVIKSLCLSIYTLDNRKLVVFLAEACPTSQSTFRASSMEAQPPPTIKRQTCDKNDHGYLSTVMARRLFGGSHVYLAGCFKSLCFVDFHFRQSQTCRVPRKSLSNFAEPFSSKLNGATIAAADQTASTSRRQKRRPAC